MKTYSVMYITPHHEALVATMISKARAELVKAIMTQELEARIAAGVGYMHDMASTYEIRVDSRNTPRMYVGGW